MHRWKVLFLLLIISTGFIFVIAQPSAPVGEPFSVREGESTSIIEGVPEPIGEAPSTTSNACFLWTHEQSGEPRCTSSLPSPGSVSGGGVTSYSGCECIGYDLNLTGCVSTVSFFAKWYDNNEPKLSLASRSTRSEIGNPVKCPVCNSEKILLSAPQTTCLGTYQNTNGCGNVKYANEIFGLGRSCEYIYNEMCHTVDEGRLVEHSPAPSTWYGNAGHVCCLDQDEDSHGVTEYNEEMCGGLKRARHDCDDSDKRVWRGCRRDVVDLALELSDETKTKMQNYHVNFGGHPTVGKNEKCLQEQDWNKDGTLPRNSWQCRQERQNANLEWREPNHPNLDESEYPNTQENFVDGNKVVCKFVSTSEITKFGELKLEEQKFHIELQKRDVPSKEWQMHKSSSDLNLADDDCSDGSCCIQFSATLLPGETVEEHARNNQMSFACQKQFEIDTALRGNQVRCFAYPENAGGTTEYWKEKNETTYAAIVADHSSVVVPADNYINRVQVLLVFDDGVPAGQNAPHKISYIPLQKTLRKETLSNNPGSNDDIHDAMWDYLRLSDSNSRLKDYTHKPIFVEEQPLQNRYRLQLYPSGRLSNLPHPSIFPAGSTVKIDLPSEDIKLDVTRGVIDNIKESLSNWDYNYIEGRGDTVVVEYEGINFRLEETIITTFLDITGARTNYVINLTGSTIWISTPAFAVGAMSQGDPFIAVSVDSPMSLAHEYGHRYEKLCDEYSESTWQAQNDWHESVGISCKNPFPLCCLGAGYQEIKNSEGVVISSGNVVNYCGYPDSCKGMPYYLDNEGHDIPDPLGTKNNWAFRSIMGTERAFNNPPKIFPSIENYRATELCELRAYPGVPHRGDTICQQK